MIYPFEDRLLAGRLQLRHKRFLAEVALDDGSQITAHCPNSGSMLGMDMPGAEVRVRHVDDAKRKLEYTLELVRPPGQAWVGVNTMRPNHVAAWAIETGQVPGISPGEIRREVPYGTNSRVDLVVDDHFIEVKNTTLARQDVPLAVPFGSAKAVRAEYPVAQGTGPHIATFPDAVTARGAKHMDELANLAHAGTEATVLFLVNRADCDRFQVAADVDPTYATALEKAMAAGVHVVPLGMDVSPEGWRVRGILPIMPTTA